ncbi:SRPBCC domain-containing protein [Christiangramia sp. SM2212]|uniref:SRPBCC domain-containing protein n=1 Tax=Christiangramia sediminicola TaxID=3073267 RepID=A0ABU1ELQ1_9FLAO|nr:SRPBCC domain-containing protein [Christiangramia sp. SM2212]MDR5589309.1 SRPBCC domain-containing protein [Christiangramia sp. SM2212]
MKKVHFQVEIDCPKEKVFSIMLDKEHYRKWTAEFNPTSHYEGTWEEGSKILFLGETEDGEKAGMQSEIAKMEPAKFISIRHLGMLEKGKETRFEQELYENYYFEQKNGSTLLKVEMDTEDDWLDYFGKTWPKALQKLKEVCESNC